MLTIFLISLSFCEIFHGSLSLEVIPFVDKSNCKQNEFYNTLNFQCEPCGANKNFVPSNDHLSCICNENSIIIDETFTNSPRCIPCKVPKIPSFNQKQCISCPKSLNTTKNDSFTNVCRHFCKQNQIIVEKFQNGSYLPEIKCVSCVNGTIPNSIEFPQKCIPCPIYNWNTKTDCKCFNKTTLIENTCVPNSLLNDLSKLKNPFIINLENGEQVTSLHLEKYLYSSIYLCKTKNSTACQMLANLCAITLFKSSLVPPCDIWFNNKNQFELPWLYYGEGDAPLVLNRRKINAQYTFNKKSSNNRIQILMSTYSLNGQFQEIKPLNNYLSKICGEFNNYDNNGFRFGVDSQTTCIINQKLFDTTQMEFYNPFLSFKIDDEKFVYAIPVLITNSKSFNKGGDDMINFWVFVRRFFLIDNSLINEKKSKYIRYISSMQLRIKVREKSEGGKIYPPYLIVTYGDIENSALEKSKLKFTLSIKFQMESNTIRSIEIAIGVLSAVAVLYSGLQTWTHSRRSGKQSIDILTGVYFLIFSCGNLANIFFIVATGVSLYSFVFYKGQSVIYLLLPDKRIEKLLRNFIIVAFSLKTVEIITLIMKQISIDMFLIDWEKPRAHDIILKPTSIVSTPSTIQQQHKSTQQPVSIWRTYFIANEWNAIQSKRRINIILHLILVSFTLEIIGLKYWATSDPELKTHKENNNNTAPLHISCLIAVGVLVNAIFYFLQLLFVVGFYERFIKNRIQDFVDVCSLANISILILMLERYGFYIHGRSAHGFADTDMASMITQLQREENNLCGHRGLVPETDDQTFRIAIPATFRKYYKKLIAPMLVNRNIFPRFPRASAGATNLSSPKQKENIALSNIDKSVQAYININKFLIAFFEHAIKDLDYEVRSPLFVETLFDIEFSDQVDRGVLYTDGGHSFDNVLFYGNEFTLASFDLMVFIFISVLSSNYLLATFVTAIIFQIITALRNIGGKKNLAKKTFIDQRFLI